MCQDRSGLLQIVALCDFTHSQGKNVWLWTGFVWESLLADHANPARRLLLLSCDVIVDGPFIQAQADRALKWRGSANQRIIDVKKTIHCGTIVLYDN